MITDIILYIFSFIFAMLGSLASALSNNWHIWPPAVLDGLTYVCTKLMDFNVLLPVDTALTAIQWLVGFLVIYVSVRLLLMFINWIRGSGSIEI